MIGDEFIDGEALRNHQLEISRDRLGELAKDYEDAIRKIGSEEHRKELLKLFDIVNLVRAPSGEEAIWILATVKQIAGTLRIPYDIINLYERGRQLVRTLTGEEE